MIIGSVIVFSVLSLFQINRMTYALVTTREIPEENHEKIFRTINILILILLVSLYVGVEFNP
jgi:predicted cation transporter